MGHINNSKIIIFLAFCFPLASCDYNNGFRIENNQVLYERPWNEGHGTQIIEVDADPITFKTLGNNNMIWAKDKTHVFNQHHILDFLDPKTFQVLSKYFGKDAVTVVCVISPVKEADVNTFRLKEYVDLNGKIEILGIDKNAAYTCSENGYRRLVSSSIDEFRPLKESFYRDKTKVWWNSINVPKANPDSFEVLGGGYATDENRVYYYGREVIGADKSTFKVTSDYQAQDKNYTYIFTDRVKSISGIEQLLSIEIWNEINDKVKKSRRLKSGEIVQVWERVNVSINEVKVIYKDQLTFDLGNLNSGARSVDYGLMSDSVKLEEIDNLTFVWTEHESGIKIEVPINMIGIIPKNYNGGVLRFRVRGPDKVIVEFL